MGWRHLWGKLEVEVPQEDGQGGSHIHLGEGLPRAVSAPVAERQKALGLLAIARLSHAPQERPSPQQALQAPGPVQVQGCEDSPLSQEDAFICSRSALVVARGPKKQTCLTLRHAVYENWVV